jgi:alpha-ketoglutarate-dependent taurine dioxygenase
MIGSPASGRAKRISRRHRANPTTPHPESLNNLGDLLCPVEPNQETTCPAFADELVKSALVDGYAKFSFDQLDEEALRRSLRAWGKVTQTVLRVRTQENSRLNTYSAAFGVGAFPFHTDFAFRPQPPLLVAICNRSHTTYERPTLISDLLKLDPATLKSLHRSTWKLRSKGKTYLVSGSIPVGMRTALRWDLQVLEPANESAQFCSIAIPKQLAEIQKAHRWEPRSGLLINNWRIAHARAGEPILANEERILQRYEVW